MDMLIKISNFAHEPCNPRLWVIKKRDKNQMPIIKSKHKDLFRAPTTEDKLTLFQLLLNAHELTVNLSLALLKIIHRELRSDQYRDRSVYKHYAEAIETLRYHMLDTFQLVVAAWKYSQSPSTTPADWFPDNSLNTEDDSEARG
jgi:hypothetical protein